MRETADDAVYVKGQNKLRRVLKFRTIISTARDGAPLGGLGEICLSLLFYIVL